MRKRFDVFAIFEVTLTVGKWIVSVILVVTMLVIWVPVFIGYGFAASARTLIHVTIYFICRLIGRRDWATKCGPPFVNQEELAIIQPLMSKILPKKS